MAVSSVRIAKLHRDAGRPGVAIEIVMYCHNDSERLAFNPISKEYRSESHRA